MPTAMREPDIERAPLPGRRERNKQEKLARIKAAARMLFSTKGFAATTTYIWSKAMGYPTATDAPDPNNRKDMNSLQAVDRKHQISSNGSYELPFGTNRPYLSNAPGWLQTIVGRWQVGGIMNFVTGAPIVLTTGNTSTTGVNTITNQAGKPVVVGKIPSDIGKVTKVDNGVV